MRKRPERPGKRLWTWTALDADSKLIVSYLCGGRDASYARLFMEDVASRLTTRAQITTDGHRAYVEAVEGAFGMEVDYAMLIKLYGSPAVYDTRYSPGEVIGIETQIKSGNPDPKAHLYFVRGAPESHHADVYAALHSPDQWLLKES